VRLKRWVGGWHSGKQEPDANGNLVFESDKKIEALAKECTSTDGLLTGEVLDWLVSPDAKQSSSFFYWLGRFDENGSLMDTIEKVGERPEAARALGAYFGGLSRRKPEFVQTRLDELTREPKVCGMGILVATQYLTGNRQSVDRVRKLIYDSRIEPTDAARLLSGGGWPRNLSADECYDLLSSVAGSALTNAAAVIDFLAMWGGYFKKPLEGKLADLAWRCLESVPAQVDASDADLLAAILVDNDAGRGFRLLELVMNQPYDRRGWRPIDHYSTRRFWDALHIADKSRLLKVVFGLNFGGATRALGISWHLPELINWDEDKEILRELALEDEVKAVLVLQCTPRTGLWPLAIELLQQFPGSKRVRSMIVSRANHDQEVIRGPQSLHYQNCALEVQAILDDPNTPSLARAFLREVHDRFLEAARTQKRVEEDEAVNW